MVLINPAPNPNQNPAQGFHFFDPSLPGLNSVTPPVPSSSSGNAVSTMSFEQNKKYRKPYTMTKSRESWSDQEHDKFLEALHLFDRDWKKIEAFVGSKSVIQIRSHAQKYFQKVQKSGTNEHVPPPRPKRKASHPYPHKAPKNAPVVPQVSVPFQCSSALLDPGYVNGLESSTVTGEPVPSSSLPLWNYNNVPTVSMPQVTTDDVKLAKPVVQKCCHSSSKDSSPKTWSHDETISRGDYPEPVTVLPDFSQVYSFIGSVFDPNATDHLQRLKQMGPINRETTLLLMRNLAVNLMRPEFETHRRLLSSYSTDAEKEEGW